jgi:hypothetical protein
LDELVRGRFLPEVPKLAEDGIYRQTTYEVAPDGTFFTLGFSYDLPDGIGPKAIVSSIYVSDQGQWLTSKVATSFGELYVERVGQRYRRDKSAVALDLAVKYLIANARLGSDCVNLWRHRVVQVLGPGAAADVPASVATREDAGAIRYEPGDAGGHVYVFVFRHKGLPTLTNDGTLSPKPYEVTRAVYIVTGEGLDGRGWKEMAACH